MPLLSIRTFHDIRAFFWYYSVNGNVEFKLLVNYGTPWNNLINSIQAEVHLFEENYLFQICGGVEVPSTSHLHECTFDYAKSILFSHFNLCIIYLLLKNNSKSNTISLRTYIDWYLLFPNFICLIFEYACEEEEMIACTPESKIYSI